MMPLICPAGTRQCHADVVDVLPELSLKSHPVADDPTVGDRSLVPYVAAAVSPSERTARLLKCDWPNVGVVVSISRTGRSSATYRSTSGRRQTERHGLRCSAKPLTGLPEVKRFGHRRAPS